VDFDMLTKRHPEGLRTSTEKGFGGELSPDEDQSHAVASRFSHTREVNLEDTVRYV
jgi:hypothetical protein